jgi:hypothetical protein
MMSAVQALMYPSAMTYTKLDRQGRSEKTSRCQAVLEQGEWRSGVLASTLRQPTYPRFSSDQESGQLDKLVRACKHGIRGECLLDCISSVRMLVTIGRKLRCFLSR